MTLFSTPCVTCFAVQVAGGLRAAVVQHAGGTMRALRALHAHVADAEGRAGVGVPLLDGAARALLQVGSLLSPF